MDERRTDSESGALLIGQPGTRKTTWLWYALIRLISEGTQVVLLCWDTELYLFYLGKVYSTSAKTGIDDLPAHNKLYPIILLIDIDQAPLKGDSSWTHPQLWPILTSSPQRARYNKFLSHRRPIVYGMPLWTLDELVKGFYLQRFSATFPERLAAAMVGGHTEDHSVVAARDVTAMAQAGDAEPGTGNVAVGTVDDDIVVLVDALTAEFGFAPRDVYNAMRHRERQRDSYENKVYGLDYHALQNVGVQFIKDYALPPAVSDQVVAVCPYPRPHRNDGWDIQFKSASIAELATMEIEDDYIIQEQCNLLDKDPATSSLAGCYFNRLFHRKFSCGLKLHLIPMVVTSDSPRFAFCPLADQPTTLLHPEPGQTLVTPVEFADIGTIPLDGDRYYIPKVSNNPLFDSFTVTFDAAHRSALISVFQITMSEAHCASSKGYVHIRKIMQRVWDDLQETGSFDAGSNMNECITVRYILVCPAKTPESRRVWDMPTRWDENAVQRNHRGTVFCLLVPEYTESNLNHRAKESEGGPRRKKRRGRPVN